ncbi:MAG: ImmA/IrrE family metallo-endopeptidase, partial [Candidatus Pacebacteria bacterium]|nr:ImmA/IrrE family metallo-endopeptidase [Candidatus Paceibacterota bacterium]
MQVPYVSNESLFNIAEKFLDEYHNSRILPVPIEEIAESKLGLMILPISKLESLCDISGTIGKDFNTILIDEETYKNQENRARFTIAHEVGHVILHKQLFEKENGKYSIEDFVRFQNGLSSNAYKRLEIQAFRFGESILFPKDKIDEIFTSTLERLGDINSLAITDLEKIISPISSKFGVSGRATYNKLK